MRAITNVLIVLCLPLLGGHAEHVPGPPVSEPKMPPRIEMKVEKLTAAAPIMLPESVKGVKGQLIRIDAQAVGAVEWWVPLDLCPKETDYERFDNRLILPSQKTGSFTVLAWTVVDGKPSRAVSCLVEISENGVKPPPEPPPAPPSPPPEPPPPVPPAPPAPPAGALPLGAEGMVYVTIIWDAKQRGQPGNEMVDAIIQSATLKQALNQPGRLQLFVYDLANADHAKIIKAQGYDEAVTRANGAPALIITTAASGNKSTLRWARTLPRSEAEILDVVGKVAAGKV